ncbi:MAG TPA: NIPSNAP family protein [Mycobacteriales bacterium]|nr:NIPSNAP family protein [Mycobacteriales bacterium]
MSETAPTPPGETYELCTYLPHEGKLEALLERFRDHTVRLLARHGIRSVGYWTTTAPGERCRLVYLLAHPSEQAARANWAAFGDDPEWQQAFEASMSEGRLVESMEKTFLTLTPFSPVP